MMAGTSSMVCLTNIKRVVSVFILRPKGDNPKNVDVAVFRRCPTMPTFANHWAGISGSIEDDDVGPLEAAIRELQEETNVCDILRDLDPSGDAQYPQSCMKAGMYLDVRKNTKGAFEGRTIRVYPFSLTLPYHCPNNQAADDHSLLWPRIEMRGTEHDEMKFMPINDFLDLAPCVPGLQTAFHHATAGFFLELPQDVRDWESDRINGSAFLARKALLLANSWPTLAQSIAMLRPSMVPIVNAMKEFDERVKDGFDSETVKAELLHSLDYEAERCVNLAVDSIFNQYQTQQYQSPSKDFVIGTFSRSSTLKLILERLLQSVKDINDAQASSIRIVCSKSTPGDEGELMANDIPNACCLADNTFQQYVKDGMINIVIVGADCVLSNQLGIVNKIGTRELSQVCKQSNIPIKCFADRWKLWDDKYYPPLEGIFEVVPKELFDSIIVPSASA